jgi:hypothetical protein
VTDQEIADLAILHAEMQKVKEHYYSFSCSLSAYKDLSVHGHKDLGSALQWALADAKKKIDKLTIAHLRKYPD